MAEYLISQEIEAVVSKDDNDVTHWEFAATANLLTALGYLKEKFYEAIM